MQRFQIGANDAAWDEQLERAFGTGIWNRHLEVLKWRGALESEQHRVYPNQDGADLAARYGRLEVLEWLGERGVIAE